MIIRIYEPTNNLTVSSNVVRIVRVFDRNVPDGINQSAFTQIGGLLAGSGAGTYGELAPGSAGQYLTGDAGEPLGLRWETPSVAISDTTNYLINGGFDLAQRTTPGSLTTVSDNAYGADRWKMTRENADLQYQRIDGVSETSITSRQYGRYKKITNAGKYAVFQILEGHRSMPLRGRTVIFQIKMRASASVTIRMAIMELQTAGTIDSIPNPFITSWNVDGTDPTFGTNIAIVGAAESKSVTTSFETHYVSATIPGDSKNIICAIWANADIAANDTLDVAEAGLYTGTDVLSWSPRFIGTEIYLARRYYWKSFPLDTAPAQNTGIAGLRSFARKAGATAVAAYGFHLLTCPMRTTSATVTAYNPSAANAQVRDSTAAADCTATSAAIIANAETILVTATGNAATATFNIMEVHVSVDADL